MKARKSRGTKNDHLKQIKSINCNINNLPFYSQWISGTSHMLLLLNEMNLYVTYFYEGQYPDSTSALPNKEDDETRKKDFTHPLLLVSLPLTVTTFLVEMVFIPEFFT